MDRQQRLVLALGGAKGLNTVETLTGRRTLEDWSTNRQVIQGIRDDRNMRKIFDLEREMRLMREQFENLVAQQVILAEENKELKNICVELKRDENENAEIKATMEILKSENETLNPFYTMTPMSAS